MKLTAFLPMFIGSYISRFTNEKIGFFLAALCIEALLKCGAKDEALAVMKNYWGGMAELGADTFWELYNPKNPDESPYGGTIVNSYCHAWSCAPAYFLRRYYSEK